MNRNKSNRGERKGEKKVGKGFAAVVTGYGKVGIRHRPSLPGAQAQAGDATADLNLNTIACRTWPA
jgi:hypothetical protein